MKSLFMIKREARQALRPVYWSALLVCLVSFMVYGYIDDVSGVIPLTLLNALSLLRFPFASEILVLTVLPPLYIFVIAPLTVGRARYFLRGIGNYAM